MINNKPVIGLLAKHDEVKIRNESVLRDEMKNAIFDNGGIAIGLLSTRDAVNFIDGGNSDINLSTLSAAFNDKEKQLFREQISLCDGIILSGGPKTDDYEILVAKYCYDNDIPLLAICAGQNNIIRAVGGKVGKVPNPENHARPNDVFVHYINIDKDSKFYQIIQTERLHVNSRHKNIIVDAGPLDIVARDDDGNIEVVEDKNKKFLIAMRYHPESLYKLDTKENNIFKQFVEACKKTK